MNEYKVKIRVMYLKLHQQKIVENNLPKKLKFSNHMMERLNERHLKINKAFLKENATLNNLLDIQVTTDNRVTYLFNAKHKGYFISFVVGQNGNVLTVWKTKKIRNTNSGIHTDDFSLYENII